MNGSEKLEIGDLIIYKRERWDRTFFRDFIRDVKKIELEICGNDRCSAETLVGKAESANVKHLSVAEREQTRA